MTLPLALSLVALAGSGIVNRFSSPIPGSYILRINDGVTSVEKVAQQLQQTYGGEIVDVNGGPVPTIVVSGWSWTAAREVAYDERVDFVDENGQLSATDTQQLEASGAQNPSLDRIDQRQSTLDTRFRFPFDGSGVRIYVVDTGVDNVSTSFAARVVGGTSVIAGVPTVDQVGHGTAMAAAAAGAVTGTAKQALIVPVQVSNTSLFTLSRLEDGLRWVLTQPPGVVNLSFEATTSGTNTTLEQLVQQLHQAGFVVVAAAGNSNMDTATVVPARVPVAVTVGAIAANTHARWIGSTSDASNFGAAVDLFAPGADVKVENTAGAIVQGSGTSPAAALTSGVLATLLQSGSLTPAAAGSMLTSAATPNVLSGLNGSANLLLFADIRPATVSSGAIATQWVYCTWGVAPQWRQRNVFVSAAATDAQGNLHLAYTSSEPSMCYSGSTWFLTSAYIAVEKRNASGTLLWSVALTNGLNLTDAVLRMLIAPGGDVIVGGASADCGGVACQSIGAFAARLNGNNGGTLWTRRFDTPGNESVSGLHLAGSALTVTGTTSGQVGQASFGGNDVFLAQLDASTGIVAATPAPFQFGTADSDVANDLTFFNGAHVVAGSTGGVLGSSGLGGVDAFFATILKGGMGAFFFRGITVQVGTAGTDVATAAVGSSETTQSGTIQVLFAAGRTNGAFAGQTNQGGDDAFHLRFADTLATQSWLFQHGTAGSESNPQLTLAPDDVFVAAGSYLLKASRVSGDTAWKTTELTSRTVIVAEPSRHVYSLGGSAFDRRRAF